MAGLPVEGKRFDVLGLGSVAIDDVLHVETYPIADAKIPVISRQRNIGGLAAAALIAVARLGGCCAYAGTLGDDEYSEAAISAMQQAGVDMTYLVRRPETRPIRSTIVVAREQHTRNIFYEISGVV